MSRLLIDESPLVVLPKLACAIGLDEAIFLQQVHYWLLKSQNVRDGRRWIYNTLDEWCEQFPFWNRQKIWRIVENLRGRGVIITGEFNKSKVDRTLWYSIDYSRLDKAFEFSESISPDPTSETRDNTSVTSDQETTTETGTSLTSSLRSDVKAAEAAPWGDDEEVAPTEQVVNEKIPDPLRAMTPASEEYFQQWGRKRWKTPAQKAMFEDAERQFSSALMAKAVRWAASRGNPNIASIIGAAKTMRNDERKTASPDVPAETGRDSRRYGVAQALTGIPGSATGEPW